MFVDSHCHLDRIDLSEHNGQLKNALNYAKSCGVEQFLCISTDQKNFFEVRDIANQHPEVHCTVGVHPLADDLSTESTYDFLVKQAAQPKVVGIGETGLDSFYSKETLQEQAKSFEVHIDAAKELSLPLVIHTREAKQLTLDMIQRYQGEKPGVLHCFTEDWDMAKQAIDFGYYVSISGIVTFKQAENVRDVARKIPLDRLLIETDSPYLAPVPYRGKPCQPAYTKNTAEFLAELRGENLAEFAAQTTQNYHDLFHSK